MNVVWLDTSELRRARPLFPNIEARRMTVPEIDEAERDARYDLEARFVAQALAKGDECHGVFVDGRLASYGWYASSDTDFQPGIMVHWEGPRTRYMYKAFTLPSHRGRGLYVIGLEQTARSLATEQNVRFIFALINRTNAVSLAAASRAGYRVDGTMVACQRFGQHVVVSANARERGLTVLAGRALVRHRSSAPPPPPPPIAPPLPPVDRAERERELGSIIERQPQGAIHEAG